MATATADKDIRDLKKRVSEMSKEFGTVGKGHKDLEDYVGKLYGYFKKEIRALQTDVAALNKKVGKR